MNLRLAIQRLIRRTGYDLHRFIPETSGLLRRKRLLSHFAVEAVLDVGANIGEYALELREDIGFTGQIVSFEPLSSVYARLRSAAAGDPRWRTVHCALGAVAATREINVAANSYSSSLLEMLPTHSSAAPQSRYIARELVEIRTLDSMFDALFPCPQPAEIYLKIDTQGYELEVLRGASACLPRIGTIQLELSLVPLYRDAPLFFEMCEWVRRQNYALLSLEAGLTDDRTGQLLQVDAIFRRSSSSPDQ